MHNHDGKNNNRMMWAMMICCAVPPLLIVLFGLGGKAPGVPTWIVLGGIAVMVVVHFFMMGKHKHSDKDGEHNKDHSGHGCCH